MRNPSRETKFSGANGDRKIFIFPVQLTTSRIDNLTRLTLTLAIFCDHTCTRFLTSSTLWHQKFILYPHPADAWMLISSAPISQKRTHVARVEVLPLPAAGCMNGPTSLSPGTRWGEPHRCMFRFVFECSPVTIRLPRNADYPSLLAVTTCIHRAHRFICYEQSTQDAVVGRELADSQNCIGDMGPKYADTGKTSRCVIMSSHGCVHVAKMASTTTSYLRKLYCAACRFCGTWYGVYGSLQIYTPVLYCTTACSAALRLQGPNEASTNDVHRKTL